jgi:hypothetical protein
MQVLHPSNDSILYWNRSGSIATLSASRSAFTATWRWGELFHQTSLRRSLVPPPVAPA